LTKKNKYCRLKQGQEKRLGLGLEKFYPIMRLCLCDKTFAGVKKMEGKEGRVFLFLKVL
jgi:hypothetical protein